MLPFRCGVVKAKSASRVFASVTTGMYRHHERDAAWAAPTGEIFAGAEDGTIITGP